MALKIAICSDVKWPAQKLNIYIDIHKIKEDKKLCNKRFQHPFSDNMQYKDTMLRQVN